MGGLDAESPAMTFVRLLGSVGAAALCLAAASALCQTGGQAGGQAVTYEGAMGPYPVQVTVHPPAVIPGLAQIEVRSSASGLPGLQELRILALPLDPQRPALPPAADRAERSASDPSLFTGQLWLMSTGSWQVRLRAEGGRGSGEISIPVPALPSHVASMSPALAVTLLILLLALAFGLVSLSGAAAREGQLEMGRAPSQTDLRSGRLAMGIAGVVACGVIWLGGLWWSASAAAYARSIYKPPALTAEIEAQTPDKLRLTLADPGWLPPRSLDDLVTAQGHPLELFMLQLPGLDRIWHLHPTQVGPARFEQTLPKLPGGRYALLGQIVHQNGLAETSRAEIELPEVAGGALGPEDSAGRAGPIGTADGRMAALPTGGRLVWEPEEPLVSSRPVWLRFRVEDRQGQPARDLAPVAGALAQALILGEDLGTWTLLSTHGSVSPAAWAVANPGVEETIDPPGSEIAFPSEFPRPGRYRVFIQVRRAGQNETAVIDLRVG
jgi:hypothetical protein